MLRGPLHPGGALVAPTRRRRAAPPPRAGGSGQAGDQGVDQGVAARRPGPGRRRPVRRRPPAGGRAGRPGGPDPTPAGPRTGTGRRRGSGVATCRPPSRRRSSPRPGPARRSTPARDQGVCRNAPAVDLGAGLAERRPGRRPSARPNQRRPGRRRRPTAGRRPGTSTSTQTTPPGLDQHRPSPAAPADDVDRRAPAPAVDHRRLGAAEHDRGPGARRRPTPTASPARARAGRGGRRRRPGSRRTSPAAGSGRELAGPAGTAPSRGGHWPTATMIQVRSRGAAGRRRSRMPVSSSNRSCLRVLHGPAGRHHVLPGVRAALAARDHVVDVLGRRRRSTGSGGRRGRTRPGG